MAKRRWQLVKVSGWQYGWEVRKLESWKQSCYFISYIHVSLSVLLLYFCIMQWLQSLWGFILIPLSPLPPTLLTSEFTFLLERGLSPYFIFSIFFCSLWFGFSSSPIREISEDVIKPSPLVPPPPFPSFPLISLSPPPAPYLSHSQFYPKFEFLLYFTICSFKYISIFLWLIFKRTFLGL